MAGIEPFFAAQTRAKAFQPEENGGIGNASEDGDSFMLLLGRYPIVSLGWMCCCVRLDKVVLIYSLC